MIKEVSRQSHKPKKKLWYCYELTHLLRQASSRVGPLCPEFWDRETDNNWTQSALICLQYALQSVYGGSVITASDTKSLYQCEVDSFVFITDVWVFYLIR